MGSRLHGTPPKISTGTTSGPEKSNTNTNALATEILSANLGQAGGSNHGDFTLIPGGIGFTTRPRCRLYRSDLIQVWLIRQCTG
jgi:hypothetical protein